MVAEISIVARALHAAVLPQDHGRGVRGWVYHLINLADPELAAQLHLQGGRAEQDCAVPGNPKPFTCSELLDAQPRPDGLVSLDAGQAVSIRLTTLTARVLHALDAAFAGSDPEFVIRVRDYRDRRDREAHLRIVDLALPRSLSYAELCELPGSRQWLLRFLSRTAFSSRSGDGLPEAGGGPGAHWLLPIPRLILANLSMKWNHFAAQRDAGPPIDGNQLQRAIHPSLVVSQVHELWTEPEVNPDLRQRGFRGTVDLQLLDDLPAPLFRHFTALMHFAPFAGVGERTTEGWGQVAVERLRP